MEYNIERIETARNRVFEVGSQPFDARGSIVDASVEHIDFTVGDPSVGIGAGYCVNLSDGRSIEVSDAVEVWYAAEKEAMGE